MATPRKLSPDWDGEHLEEVHSPYLPEIDEVWRRAAAQRWLTSHGFCDHLCDLVLISEDISLELVQALYRKYSSKYKRQITRAKHTTRHLERVLEIKIL